MQASGSHGAATVLEDTNPQDAVAPGQHSASPADSRNREPLTGHLTPDSGHLIAESGNLTADNSGAGARLGGTAEREGTQGSESFSILSLDGVPYFSDSDCDLSAGNDQGNGHLERDRPSPTVPADYVNWIEDEDSYWTEQPHGPERLERYIWTAHYYLGTTPDDPYSDPKCDEWTREHWQFVFGRKLDGLPIEVFQEAIDANRKAGTPPSSFADWFSCAPLPHRAPS